MSTKDSSGSNRQLSAQQTFRPTKIAIAISTALSIFSANPLYAADDKTIDSLQAEITRLKEALDKSQQELAAQKGNQQPASAINETTLNSSAPVAATENPQEQQKDLDTVVVRGRNRLESVKDVPVSISVVTGKELDRLEAHDLASITQRVGNVSWVQGNARTSALSIRGIGKQAQTDAMDPSVGITVDGISYAYNPFASFDLYDVNSVEVARGPQGTLRGKNASVGAVTVTTNQPSFKDHIDYSLTLGQNNRVIANTNVTGPVIEDLLAWRGSLAVDKGQGDYPNGFNNDFTYKNKDNVSGRVQFLLTPSENFNATFKGEVTPRHEEYYNGWVFNTPTPTTYANGATNNLTSTNAAVSGASVRLARNWFTSKDLGYTYNDYLSNKPFADNQRPLVTGTNSASAILNWNLGSHTLTSISGYKNFYFQARNDEGTPYDVSKNGGGFVSRDEQFSQEFRLASELGGKVDYQVGTIFIKQSNNYNSNTGFGADAGAWFASDPQYNNLNANSSGRALLQDSLNGMQIYTPQDIESKSAAVYGQANWHLSDPLTVTTGARLTLEDRENSQSKFLALQGSGASLNQAAQGGFSSDATTGALIGINTAAQNALANQLASKYFGSATYAGLTTAQQAQVANAKALRKTNQGFLFSTVKSNSINDIEPTLLFSPSYKFNDNVTGYVSLQYGVKAGIAQVLNGQSKNADSEKTAAYELGIKTSLLDKTLTFNADVYLSNIKNYQQQVLVADSTSTTGYTALTGNVAGVRAYGLEVDAVYSGLPHTNLRFSGAYNQAYYTDFKNSAQPVENNNIATGIGAIPYRDVTGETLPGAAKFTFNVGADYRYPVLTGKEFHTSINTAYTSRYNSDIALSSYAWVPSYSITDFSIGIGRKDKKFDTSLLVKNLFNDDTSQVNTWNTYVPTVPRWVGVVFSGEL
jgi:iron complex outermembrane receptor protein